MTRHVTALLAAGLLLAAASASAHHSFSAEYDVEKPVTVTGTIVGMRWSNPHAWIYIEVKEPDGTAVKWAFETAAANQLYRRGWRREDVPDGAMVTVAGWRARNGTPTANAGTIKFTDGKQLFAGPPPTAGAQ
ncbi:MAG: hypothetical protein FJW14_18795 [Acidimicrobiia bacterium]|nr:hypothetical protein [Acidimicrobiia bacterium]